MILFVLGLMPAFILLQFFLSKPTSRLFWHIGVGVLLYTPFVALRALLLNTEFSPDYMTFFSEWWVSFVLDALLPVAYLLLAGWLFLQLKLVDKATSALSVTLSTFFALDGVVFVLFMSSADGVYELLIRPIVYLLLVFLLRRMFMKFHLLPLLFILITMLIAPAVDALFFMNRYGLAALGLAILAALAIFSALLDYTKGGVREIEQSHANEYSAD